MYFFRAYWTVRPGHSVWGSLFVGHVLPVGNILSLSLPFVGVTPRQTRIPSRAESKVNSLKAFENRCKMYTRKKESSTTLKVDCMRLSHFDFFSAVRLRLDYDQSLLLSILERVKHASDRENCLRRGIFARVCVFRFHVYVVLTLSYCGRTTQKAR